MEITLKVPDYLGKRLKALSSQDRDSLAAEALEKTLNEKEPPPKKEVRLLQKGKQRPVRAFKAISMKGKGPTALEMVQEGRT